MSIKALEHYLLPLQPFLQLDNVTEICINQPQEVYVEKSGEFIAYFVPSLELNHLKTLAHLLAEFNNQDNTSALLSGVLPTGERIQIVKEPVSENQKIIFSIRKQKIRNMTLDDYEKIGAFTGLINPSINNGCLAQYYAEKDIANFLKTAIIQKKNILISGGTGTGKTTFLNACLKLIPQSERIITIEDTREVEVAQPNKVQLIFNEEIAAINSLNVFKGCLRLRPDRILLSELRGKEVWPYLRAANSGHPGSLSTIHADTPYGAITQLVFMMQQAGSTSTEAQLRKYIESIIHVIVQLKRDRGHGYYVSDWWYSEAQN